MQRSPKSTQPAARTLQNLRGTGQVYADKVYVCDVRYGVTVKQTIVYAGSRSGAGAVDMRGTIVVGAADPNWRRGAKLVLHLEDGRTAVFATTTDKAATGVYGIQVETLTDPR